MAELALGVLMVILLGTPILLVGLFLLVITPRKYRSGHIGPILFVKGLLLGVVAVGLGLAVIVGGGTGAVRHLQKLKERPVAKAPAGWKSQLELNREYEQSRDARFQQLRQRSEQRTGDLARPKFKNPGDFFPADDPFNRDEDFRLYPASEVMAEEGPIGEMNRAKAAAKRQPRYSGGVPAQANRPAPRSRPAEARSVPALSDSQPPPQPRAAASEPGQAKPAVVAVAASASLDPATEVWLRDLQPVTSEVLTRDEHQLLRDFVVGGIRYSHGLYTHPPDNHQPARVTFQLDGKYERLRGSAGQMDGFPPTSASTLTFKVLGDGKELWSSREIGRHGESEAFDISVAGVNQLELRTECPGLHSFAWGVWADPVLSRKSD